MTTNLAVFALAAFLEIAGCFAFWLWVRRDATPAVAVVGVVSLIGFAFALTRIDSAFAGRAFAAYRRHLHRRVSDVALGGRGPDPFASRCHRYCVRGIGRSRDHRLRREGALRHQMTARSPDHERSGGVLERLPRRSCLFSGIRPSHRDCVGGSLRIADRVRLGLRRR